MAQPRIYRRGVLLAKTETTEGTFEAPASTDAILFRSLSVAPVSGSGVDRANQDGTLSTYGRIPVDTHGVLTFTVENAGSGAAGTAPAFGTLLKACGLSETITANTSVVYRPADSGFDSVSFIANIDGHNYRFTGARGTAVFAHDINEVPLINFTFTTRKAVPLAKADLPAVDVSDFQIPLEVNHENFEFRLDATAAKSIPTGSVSFDLGNSITHRSMVGAEDVVMTNRLMGGSVTFDQTDDFDHIKASQDGTELMLNFGTKAGVAAGSRMAFTAGKVLLTDAALNDTNGYLQVSGGLRLTGNDFTLTYS